MLAGIVFVIYYTFIIGTIVLTPCYFIKNLKSSVFKYSWVIFFYRMSLVFHLLTILSGILFYQEALENPKLLDATILEKAWGIFSYAYGWILPYWGVLFVVIAFFVSLIIQLLKK